MSIPDKKKLQMAKDQEERDFTRERDTRAVPLLEKWVKIIGAHEKQALGSTDTPQALYEAYQPLAVELLRLSKESDIQSGDFTHLFNQLRGMIGILEQIVTQTIAKKMQTVEEAAFGCTLPEMKVSQLHGLLTGEEDGKMEAKAE